MTKNSKSQEFACDLCGQPQTSIETKRKHKQKYHKSEYGPALLIKQIQELQNQIDRKNLIIQELQENYDKRINNLTNRITELNVENQVLKQQIGKLGKKKISQTKVQVDKELKQLQPVLQNNYAAYKIDLFEIKEIIEVSNQFLGKLADVLIIDPPFSDTMIEFKYEVVKDKTIKNLQIEYFQKSGLLFLWVTKKKLPFGLKFFKMHGYTYIDTIVWEKIDENQNLIGGPGYYLDHQFEICLMGRKGAYWENIILHSYPDIIKAPRLIASQKPKDLYSLIEQLVPNCRYVELFARDHNITEGWISLGKQISEINFRKLQDGLVV